MGTNAVRVVLGVIGVALILGGLVVGYLFTGVVPAFWMIVSGIVLLIVAVIEVTRYRSEAAERIGAGAGPGGGEPGPPESRFRPTDEVFVDPTTHRQMRVYADGRTGERRYVAEG